MRQPDERLCQRPMVCGRCLVRRQQQQRQQQQHRHRAAPQPPAPRRAPLFCSASHTQGDGKLIFQGVISYLACILITYLGFAMLRFANMERKYMRKLDSAARTVSRA
jgi:hypothetical protein